MTVVALLWAHDLSSLEFRALLIVPGWIPSYGLGLESESKWPMTLSPVALLLHQWAYLAGMLL